MFFELSKKARVDTIGLNQSTCRYRMIKAQSMSNACADVRPTLDSPCLIVPPHSQHNFSAMFCLPFNNQSIQKIELMVDKSTLVFYYGASSVIFLNDMVVLIQRQISSVFFFKESYALKWKHFYASTLRYRIL